MKILWTFDPFEKNVELHNVGENICSHLFGSKDQVKVIYVASNTETMLATAYNIPEKKRYSEFPKKLIKEQLKNLSIKVSSVDVLFERTLSLTSIVKKVVDFTQINDTDMVIIASKSKKDLPHFIFGSFAETFVHLATCDLLIYHQKSQVHSQAPQNIIYAHDFTPKGFLGLERIIEYAKKWKSFLTIVHVPVPVAGVELHEFKKRIQKQASKIEKILEKHNIKGKIYLDYEVKPIAEILVDISVKTNADFISVTAQTKRLATLLGGSVTRQVLRESKLPTIVLKV
jgi:nucleotide-binding universal stress UspA family protein